MRIARTQIWVAEVCHRDRSVKQAFELEAQAHAWVRDRKARDYVVSWKVEALWLSAD